MCTQETEEQPRTRGRATTTMFRYYACMLSVETCNAIHRVVLRYVVHLLALPPPPRPIPSWPVVLRALTPSYAWLDDNNNTDRGSRERDSASSPEHATRTLKGFIYSATQPANQVPSCSSPCRQVVRWLGLEITVFAFIASP